MAQKQVYPIFVTSNKEKYTPLLQELTDFISPVSVPLSSSDIFETIGESDLILCIIDKEFWNNKKAKEQLKHAKNLNKSIVCIIPDRYGIIFKIINYFHCLGERFHIFNWYDSTSKEECVLQLIEWLGLLMPMVDVFGKKINLSVIAKKGFILKVDDKHFNFYGNVEVSFRVKEGNHRIICTDSRNNNLPL